MRIVATICLLPAEARLWGVVAVWGSAVWGSTVSVMDLLLWFIRRGPPPPPRWCIMCPPPMMHHHARITLSAADDANPKSTHASVRANCK